VSFETLSYEKQSEFIGLLKISRPKALNALNAQVLDELGEALTQIEEDRSLRCLILTGDGEKAFIAGADIKEMAGMEPAQALEFAKKGQSLTRRLEKLRMPVIAAVNGFALGGGTEFAISCDFIIASENARFGLPEVSLGIIPGFGGTQRLARFVGLPRAREMIYTGNHYSAEQAKTFGLANEVVPQSELLEAALKFAKDICKRGPVAVAVAKRAANEGYDKDIDGGLEIEREVFGELFVTKDQVEGTTAFVEKRKPEFKGE
jgi:enoyl-CoA hydratase